MSARRRPAAVLGAALLAVAGPTAARANDGGAWASRAPLQVARQETGAARLGDCVYVVGGLLPGFVAPPTVERYEVALDLWTFAPPLPVGLDHMAVAAAGGRIYVIGGYSGDFRARAEVWTYAPGESGWSPGPPLPQPRG